MNPIVKLTGGITVCLFLAVMMNAIQITMIMQSAKTCIGEIRQISKVESKKSTVMSMLIVYTINEVEYQYNLNGNGKYKVGDKVSLIYQENNPLDVSLKAQVYQRLVSMSLITLIGGFITGVTYLLTK